MLVANVLQNLVRETVNRLSKSTSLYKVHIPMCIDRVYLVVFLKARDSAGLLQLIQLVNGHPEAGGSHLCLPTHHQLTQSMVDELILHLQDEGRHLRDTRALEYELNIQSLLLEATYSISRCMQYYN